MKEISTFYPQDFHEISTTKMWFKANNDGDFAEFSTKSPSLVFFFFCEKNIISLIFLIFCLDKGVHFITFVFFTSCGKESDSENVIKPTKKEWEYKSVCLKYNSKDYTLGKKDIMKLPEDITALLNEQGKEGWELVSNPNIDHYFSEYNFIFIFKRPKGSELEKQK